jgi:DNA gyrase subunit A
MRLRRLTGLEREKIESELAELLATITELKAILASEDRVLEVIKEELLEIKQKYGDERRTNIDMTAIEYIEDESLIPEEDIIINLTKNGYIKRLRTDTYKTQNRGGVGIKGMTTNEEDFVEHLISMNTHDYILFFSNMGRVYRMKGYEIPEFSRQSKGLPIVNLLPLEKDENISSIISICQDDDNTKYLMFVTKNGIVKRTPIEEFDNIRKSGKIAIVLKENDELISVKSTCGKNEIVIGASNGRLVRFDENEVRSMGRSSSGVKGMELDGAIVVGAEVVEAGHYVLIVTEKGYGKQTVIDEYRLTHRGSKGVKAFNVTDKNGMMASLKCLDPDDSLDLMIITDSGIIIKLPLEQVSTLKRATQGVRLINLKDDQKVSTVALVLKDDDNSEENNNDLEQNQEVIVSDEKAEDI